MRLFQTEFNVVDLTRTSLQGWLGLDRLTEMTNEGWSVIGSTALGSSEMKVLLSRRRWLFWRKQNHRRPSIFSSFSPDTLPATPTTPPPRTKKQ